MKILAPFMLVAAVLAVLPSSESSTVDVDRVKASLVRISMDNAEGEEGFCTGFVIDPGGRVATAAHCVEGMTNIKVDGNPAHVLKIKGWAALLDGIPGIKPPLQLAKNDPKLLETVWAFGNANGWDMFVLQRQVADILQPIDGDHKDIFVDGGLIPGMSGGPIVNAKGEVIAINQMTFGSFGLGCEIKTVKELLK